MPAGSTASAGQLALDPVQASASSQSPAAGRHSLVLGSKFGPHVPAPSHVSGLSQTVSLGSPHVVPVTAAASAGQLPAPSQLSAASHSSTAGRQLVVDGSWLERHVPAASQLSGSSHDVSAGSPQVVPVGAKESAGHAPAPSHCSATSHAPASARHSVVVGSLFARQEPDALHVSGLSQTVSLALPHAVPDGSNASAGHAPAPLQFSATSHAPASARHTTDVGSLFARHEPIALQVSGLSQIVSLALPHAVPAGSNASAGHAPAPLQFSATSHAPASVRHTTDVGSLFARQEPEALQVSGLSQTVSLALPHAVPAASNASAGHAPAPLQFSATSQAPASARQTTLVGSLFAAHAPEALHESGLSQTVSLALPHAVPTGSNASAGHAPAPSQFSATSQAPASARHKTLVGSKLPRHVPAALHVFGLSHTVSAWLPHTEPAGSNALAGHPPMPLQNSATSQSPASARHTTVVGSKLLRHVPVALHVFGLSHTVSVWLPHAVPAG
jgi:hypothetical protein